MTAPPRGVDLGFDPSPPGVEGGGRSPPPSVRNTLALAALTLLIGGVVGTLSILDHYRSTLGREESYLASMVEAQARMIEAVARFDARFSENAMEGGAFAATLSQMAEAQGSFHGFGSTGVFVLGERVGDSMVFHSISGYQARVVPRSLYTGGGVAAPMRAALAGESGVLRGPDLRKVTVLAAFRPLDVADHELGLVAKKDLAEVQGPVMEAAGDTAAAVILLTLALALLYHFLGQPFLRRVARTRAALQATPVAPRQTETELGEREEDLARTASDLVRMEEELRRSAEVLRRSNEDLQELAYVASHDLQEPLRMVSSFTQLLADRYRNQLDQDAREFIDYAVDGATRMQRLIQGLLRYSRVESRGEAFRPVNAETVLAGTVRDLRAATEERGARIIHHGLPVVAADPAQLGQLFLNLINNALEHGTAGQKGRVEVGAERGEGEWAFFVRDNGPGIDPAYTTRIFQLFQRLGSRDELTGTGIGLPICKRIVQRHGGRIWVDSEPGHGATFFFTIPDRRVPHGPIGARAAG